METLAKKWRRNSAVVNEELRKLAATHTHAFGGKLRLIDHDPKTHPEQGIKRVVNGEPKTNYGAVHALAKIAEKQFDPMVEKLLKNDQMLRSIGEHGKPGHPFTIVTLHEEDPIDIAIAGCATLIALHELGYDMRLGTVVSKMMAHLGYEFFPNTVLPTVDALKNTGDIYLSFPRTKSIQESAIADELVGLYNSNLRIQFNRSRKVPNQLFAVAPTGTRARSSAEDPSQILIPRVGSATIDMIKGMVLPIALRTNADELLFEALEPRAVTNRPEMGNTMLELCQVTTRMVGDGTNHVYLGSAA